MSEKSERVLASLALLLVASLVIWSVVYLLADRGMSLAFRSIAGSLIVAVALFASNRFWFRGFVVVAGNPVASFIVFFIGYYCIGIAPVSSYRGYVDGYWWGALVLFGVIAFLVGVLLAKALTSKKASGVHRVNSLPRTWVVNMILAASMCAATVVVAKHGFVFVNPEERFSISAKLSYIVELAIPAVITHFAYSISVRVRTRAFLLPAIFFVVLLTLGYRNQPMLLLIGVVLVLLLGGGGVSLLEKYRIWVALILAAVFFFLGASYLVRTNSSSVGRTLDWDSTVSTYEIAAPQLLLPLIPLHLAAREGMGVSQVAVERIDQVESFVPRPAFFVLDFLTMLPGHSLTSGRVLGIVVNFNETSSLTPSLLGGLYISFGFLGVLGYLCFTGYLLQTLLAAYSRSFDPGKLALLVVAFSYSVELVNRGIFKPMYIFAFLVPVLISRSVRRNG